MKSLFADAIPKPVSVAMAPIVMIDAEGRPTNKPDRCWKWTRLQLGFGWHPGPPEAFLLKSKDSACNSVK